MDEFFLQSKWRTFRKGNPHFSSKQIKSLQRGEGYHPAEKKIRKIVFERLPLAVRVARIVNKREWDIYVIRH